MATAEERRKERMLPTASVIDKETIKATDWKQIQNRTFKNWSNFILSAEDENKVSDLLMDFSDGVNLIELLNHLAQPKQIKNYAKQPKTYFQRLDNLSKAFEFMTKEENIKLVGIGAYDMIEGREVPVMGLIWSLIKHYKIRKLKGTSDGKDEQGNFQDSIIKVVNNIIEPRYVKNLDKSWNDGIAICALVEGLAPKTIDLKSLNPENGLENCAIGIQTGYEALNIPMLVAPEDMNSEFIESISMMTYLSNFIPKFNDDLLDWVNSIIPENKAGNFSSDWNSGERLQKLMNAHFPQFFEPFDEGNTEAYQGLLDKIDNELGVKCPLSAEQMMAPDVDRITVSGYLHQMKNKLRNVKIPSPEPELEPEPVPEPEPVLDPLIEQEREAERARYENQKENLKDWLNEMLRPDCSITNFDSDWRNGNVLTRFINAINPNTVPMIDGSLTDEEKCNNALTGAQNKFGVKPDFTGEEMSQNLVEEWKLVEYINQTVAPFYHELLAWINPKLPEHEKANGFGDEWSDGKKLINLLNTVSPGFIEGNIDISNMEEGQALLDRIDKGLGNPCPFSYEQMIANDYDPKMMAAYLNRFREIQNPHTEDKLMQWLNCMLYPSDVNNLTDDWQDGKLLGYLVQVIDPNSISIGEEFAEMSAEERCEAAINAGQKLGIVPRDFTACDLASGNANLYMMRQYLGDYMDHFMHENRDLVRDAKRGLRDTVSNNYPELITCGNTVVTTEDKKAIVEAAQENYDFSFPMDDETIAQLNEEHPVTTAFLYKLKQAPLRPPPTPINGKEEVLLTTPLSKQKPSPDLSKAKPSTALLEGSNSSAARRRRRIQSCICLIVIIATILVILVLVGVFVGLARGVWNI